MIGERHECGSSNPERLPLEDFQGVPEKRQRPLEIFPGPCHGATMDPISKLIRACYAAYENKDRPALEKILADDFTFSSPIDDCISRERYFERCWPNSRHLEAFKIEKLQVEGDEATVRYEATATDGAKFRNVEVFTVRDGKIRHVDVFFGSDTAETVSTKEIEAVVTAWANGIRNKDVDAVAGQFAEEPVGFYLAPPLVADMPLRENLSEWFATFDGPIGYEVRDLVIEASGEKAWCHALNHLTATKTDGENPDLWFRLTLGMKKVGDRWKIAHAHESVPFLMDGSGMAALGLRP